MPPELLHTSGSGLITYMFESLQWQIGGGKIRDDVDKLHIRVYMFVKRQSERDFPRGAIRNGIIDGTKCQSEERKGNLFQHAVTIAFFCLFCSARLASKKITRFCLYFYQHHNVR